MSTPGVSLFQGAESIKVNSDLDRAEEEEELEDQRRRNEEIGNLLQNAFDDLEDDDVTVDSTTNYQSDFFDENGEARLSPKNGDHYLGNINNNFNIEQYESEMHQLKMLLESRTNELENIKKMAKEDFSKKDELQKRLMIAEAECDRALAGKNNTHELLVESKEKCSNLENIISKLKNEKKSLEEENRTLFGKLTTSQTILADVQRKYDMVERDLNRNNDRNGEYKRKQMEDRHRAEMDVLRQQLEQMDDKLRKKTHEFETMDTRYQALQNTHDMMLIDKGSKINDLNNALSEAQNKCEELLQREDYFQENIRLQKLVASLQDQVSYMEKTIKTLNERLEQTTAEIDVMDSLLHQHNLEGTPSRLVTTQNKGNATNSVNTVDRIASLKDELYRALANVKAKREEVKSLQQTIEEKNIEIHHLKSEENKALVTISTLKEDKIRLENRIKYLEEDLEEVRMEREQDNRNHATIHALNTEIKMLRDDKESLQTQYKRACNDLNEAERKVKQLDTQLKNVQVDLEELKQEYESMKLNYDHIIKENKELRNQDKEEKLNLDLEKHKFLLKDSQTECDRLKTLYIEISNEKEVLTYELEKLRKADNLKELQEHRDKIASLQRALQLAEMKCVEVSKLLESEKLYHQREVDSWKEKLEKEKANQNQKAADTSNNCSKCLDYMAEITKFQIQNLKISNLNSLREKEIEELNDELKESKSLIKDYKEKLKLTEQQEQLINELKTKATEFEEYIKTNSPISTRNSPKVDSQSNKNDKCVEASMNLQKDEISKIEARIREEMAKIFASQLKLYQTKFKDSEERYICIQREYHHILNEMHQRETEVELLKEAILAEREKLQEIIKEKEDEYEVKLQISKKSVTKAREELQIKSNKVTELKKELDERQKQIEAERKSMKAVMLQWEEQRKSTDQVEAEWREKLEDLKKTFEGAMSSWQTKYNSAKLTARNYKRYAEDKEAHMLKEYNRIKQEYNSNLTKLEARLHEELAKKDIELKKRVDAIEKKRLKHHDDKEDKENQVNN